MKIDVTELPPCPFCGSKHVSISQPTCTRLTPYNAADRAFPAAVCQKCYASAQGANWDESGKTAITAWNRRTNPAADKLARIEAVLASDEAVERVARAMTDADRGHFGSPPMSDNEWFVWWRGDSNLARKTCRVATTVIAALVSMGEG